MSMQAMLMPVFAQVALTFVLLFWMQFLRLRAVRHGLVPAYAVALREPNWPVRVTQIGNAYHNQLETPLLFYVLILLAMVTQTADSILLYAGGHPVFVVDAYTRRLLERHRILPQDARYEEIRLLFEQALSAEEWPVPGSDRLGGARPAARGASHSPSRMSNARRSELAQVFNEMHGLIVGVAKNYCLASKALCEQCPLGKFLHKRVRACTRRPRFTGGRET